MHEDGDEDEPVEVDPGDTLDLHVFAPREAAEIVSDWLDDCLEAGRTHVRIIHGKGTGTLARIVRSVLEKHPAVARFGQDSGNWGATRVELKAS